LTDSGSAQQIAEPESTIWTVTRTIR